MIARIVADQRRQAARVAASANKPGPSNQRRRRQPRQKKIGVKNIERRIRGRSFKMKRLLAQQRNNDVKKNGIVIRKMVVRRRTIFPAEVRRVYYQNNVSVI